MCYRLRTLLIVMTLTATVMEEPHRLSACDDETPVQQIVRLLDSIPEWPILPLNDKVADFEQKRQNALSTAKKIEAIAAEIAEYDTELIRAAFVEFSTRKNVPRRDALDIVNRYLFKLPERPTSLEDDRMTSYRYATILLPSDIQLTSDFPWKFDESGKARFSIEGRGFIGFGKPYDGVKAFDYYREHFGRRKLGQTTPSPDEN